jgi:hypothetical protein
MLHTNGRDYVADSLGNNTSRPAVANILGLTANSTPPAAGDTSLTGKITTPGAGLAAAVATYAHTTGAATYTLTRTFVANGTDTLPVTIAKVSVENAGGAMPWSSLLSPTAQFSAVGDSTAITETITIS